MLAGEDFTFTMNEDGAVLVGYNGSETTVAIPAEYQGRPVVAIGDKAFYQSAVTRVSMPDTITRIGDNAFAYSAQLQDVTLSAGLQSLGEGVFYQCSALTEITIPDGLTELPENTFNYCTSLQRVVLPSGLTTIGSSGFYRCAKLTDINVPATVKTVGSSAFYGCSGLSNTQLAFIENLTSIGTHSFVDCTGLKSVTFNEALTEIYYEVFKGCYNLTKAEIPAGVKYIDASAFSGTSLQEIRGYVNTCAEQYAADNSIPFVPLDADDVLTKPTFTLSENAVLYTEGAQVTAMVRAPRAGKVYMIFDGEEQAGPWTVTDGTAVVTIPITPENKIHTIAFVAEQAGQRSPVSAAAQLTVTWYGVLPAPVIQLPSQDGLPRWKRA